MADHAHSTAHAEHGGDHEHHVNYWRVYWLLLALLCVSVLGPMLEIRVVTIITAFGIAAYKAYLVAKNFMHVNLEKPFVSYLLLTVVVFMFLFFAGTAPDVMKRYGTNWEKPAWVAAHEAAQARAAAGGTAPAAHGEHAPAAH